MRDFVKLVSWLTLSASGIALVIWALIYKAVGTAIGLAIGVGCVWTAWGTFLGWVFGIRRHMQKHLQMSLSDATFQEKEISSGRLVDLRRALEQLYAGSLTPLDQSKEPSQRHSQSTSDSSTEIGQHSKGQRYGIDVHRAFSFSTLQEGNMETKPLKWATLEGLSDCYENYPTNAVYLLHHEGQPFVVSFGVPSGVDVYGPYGDSPNSSVLERLQIFSQSIEAGTKIIDALLKKAGEHSIYRGKLLYVSPADKGVPGQLIRITERPTIDKEKIILPAEIFDILRRGISTRLKYHELLQRHGHSSKTGILLHGVPGTGKTLVSKYLIGDCEDYTAIVPAGMELETVREAFKLAAYLQPSLIVIEDVDLLAERRETNANVTGLQELMNEMDGLAATTETIVVMTTNRPEILEPALASRPGRVSQAIHFPLPDAELREKLLTLFCKAADVSKVELSHWAERTDGASPAFLEELTKRAMLFAAERSDISSKAPLKLTDHNFDQAIHELVVYGGQLTAGILGFPEPDRKSAIL